MKEAKTFYDSIANKYDWFFSSFDDLMKRHMKDLMPILLNYNVKTVLDCACGTGLHVIGLKKEGFEVIGSDLSQKMLEQAKKNAFNYEVNLPFVQADFRALDTKFTETFDSVVCLGNSLPHLFSKEDILKSLKNMYQLTKENGILIIEMRDYDELVKDKVRFFPMRVNSKQGDNLVTIFYVLDHYEDRITFNVVYITQNIKSQEVSTEVESVDYNPIRQKDLIDDLKAVGFKKVEVKKSSDKNMYISFK